MKALTVDSDGKLAIREFSIPEYGRCQALVKLRSCGVCNGTDTKLIHRTFKNFDTYPAILGHEGVGEVVETGVDVKHLKKGDLVLLPFLEKPIDGYTPGWGAYSEYAVVGDAQAYIENGKGPGTPQWSEGYLAQTVLRTEDKVDAVGAAMIITFREVLSAIRRFGFTPNESVLVCQRRFEIVRKRRRNFVIFRRGGVTNSSVSLLKKCAYDLLLLAHKFLALLQTVRLALDVDDSAVVQDAVQDGGGDGDVGKDLIPLREGLVGGKDGGRLLVPPCNELEEQIGPLDIHGKIADLVDDKHPVLGENLEFVRQTVLKMGLFELLDELVTVDVVGRETVLGCHKAQGRGQMFCPHRAGQGTPRSPRSPGNAWWPAHRFDACRWRAGKRNRSRPGSS